jgi:hypothetical protein
MKIDVEGFEAAVMKGAGQTLANSSLLALMLETVDEGILATLNHHGFARYRYNPFSRALLPIADDDKGSNQIFIRNTELVAERLAKARSFVALGNAI